MDAADKFMIFAKICVFITIVLGFLNTTDIINISWWIVFAPVILVIVLIMKELGAFNQ
jgi:hypothetical protein